MDRVAGAAEALEEPADTSKRCGTESVAVVSVGESDEAAPFRLGGLLAKLERHLLGHLDGGRSIVGEKDPLQRAFGEKRGEFPRQFSGERMSEAEKRRVTDFFRLPLDGGGDAWVSVAVDVRPDRGIPIEIALALRVEQPGALSVRDDGRLVVWIAPIILRRERMPAVALVEIQPSSGVVAHRGQR